MSSIDWFSLGMEKANAPAPSTCSTSTPATPPTFFIQEFKHLPSGERVFRHTPNEAVIHDYGTIWKNANGEFILSEPIHGWSRGSVTDDQLKEWYQQVVVAVAGSGV